MQQCTVRVTEGMPKFIFQLIVEAHTHNSPALGFNLVANLVIEAIQVGVVRPFFRFLESVIGPLRGL